LIQKITDEKGLALVEVVPKPIQEDQRAIDARNAFVMTSLLQEVTRSGTAAKARVLLKRDDIYGKTGTTNDSHDAWFAGYGGTISAVTWIGYDNPRKLGDKETGGGLSLPVWISFMETALRGVPVKEAEPPEGVINRGGEWFFEEFTKGSGVTSLGLDSTKEGGSGSVVGPLAPIATPSSNSAPAKPASEQEKKSILDLFRN
jgi:penicillin-binding protein 1A